MKLFDATFGTLEHALDVRTAKQSRLASNLANLDTPHYKPQDVDFEASMEAFETHRENASQAPGPEQMAKTAQGHLDVGGKVSSAVAGPIVADDLPASATLDDNTVDLDHTMAELAENATQYSAVTRVVRKKLAMLRYVASDGTA